MLGSNVPTIGGLPKGFYHADEWGCECIGIYITLSRTWAVKKLTEQAIKEFKLAWKNSKVKEVVAHIPYLVNPASSNPEVCKKAFKRLKTEVAHAKKLGVKYLVLHPGSYGEATKEQGMKKIITAIDSALSDVKDSPMILLETMAGQGTMIGSRFEEIAQIIKSVKKSKLVGVCFDTAHVFEAGYDITDYKKYNQVMKEFDKIIGLNKIKAIHVNDSKTALGSRKDRHEIIGKGKIGLKAFHLLVRDKRFLNTPMILELPDREGTSQSCLALLKKLRKKPL